MATERVTCPDCGETFESADQTDVQEISEITSTPKGGIGYGEATHNLFLCKNCRKPLGVGKRGNE